MTTWPLLLIGVRIHLPAPAPAAHRIAAIQVGATSRADFTSVVLTRQPGVDGGGVWGLVEER
jgi:hypothetical protein